jgi:hypothetical protein
VSRLGWDGSRSGLGALDRGAVPRQQGGWGFLEGKKEDAPCLVNRISEVSSLNRLPPFRAELSRREAEHTTLVPHAVRQSHLAAQVVSLANRLPEVQSLDRLTPFRAELSRREAEHTTLVPPCSAPITPGRSGCELGVKESAGSVGRRAVCACLEGRQAYPRGSSPPCPCVFPRVLPRALPSGGAAAWHPSYPTACCASSPSVSGGLLTKGGDASTRMMVGGTHRVDRLV